TLLPRTSPISVRLKLITGTKRNSISGGLNAESPLISEIPSTRFSTNCDCRLRPHWAFDCGRAVHCGPSGDCPPIAVGPCRHSNSVSETRLSATNQSSPNTGRSPFSVFGLYGWYQGFFVGSSCSVLA